LTVAARVRSVYSPCGPAGMISSGAAARARPAATLSSSIGLGMIGTAIVVFRQSSRGAHRPHSHGWLQGGSQGAISGSRPVSSSAPSARPCQDRRKISTAHSRRGLHRQLSVDRASDHRYRTSPIGELFPHFNRTFYHDGRSSTLPNVVDHHQRREEGARSVLAELTSGSRHAH
jgi:hypothetical protein